jgi:hypothetical protein
VRAELEFDTPDPQVRLVFHDVGRWLDATHSVMTITNMPFNFAKELQRRWNAGEGHAEPGKPG